MENPDILVVGSHAPGMFIEVNQIPVTGETVMGWNYREPVDGGKGSNQAVAAARLGGAVRFVGCFGRDQRGNDGVQMLETEGIDTAFIIRSDMNPTIGGFVILDKTTGIPAIVAVMGANGDLTQEAVDRALAASPSVNVLLTQFEIDPELALYAARQGRATGITTIVNPAPAIPIAGLELVDFLTPNETEAKTLLSLDPQTPIPAHELAERLRAESGAKTVIVTLGEKGVVVADPAGVWNMAAPQVIAVDTTGAGDAFNGALAVGLSQGRPLPEIVRWACQAAALAVTRKGTIPTFPTSAEVKGKW
jgi:ribokinase